MPRTENTRARIVESAAEIFLSDNLTATSIDRICEKSGITKKSFYYHFESKDEVMQEVMFYLKPHYLNTFKTWSAEAGEKANLRERMLALFAAMNREAQMPNWRGCCVLQIAAELGGQPGHPARIMAAEANKQLATWFANDLTIEKHPQAGLVAGQLLMLLNGFIITQVVHRDSIFLESALDSINTLVPAI